MIPKSYDFSTGSAFRMIGDSDRRLTRLLNRLRIVAIETATYCPGTLSKRRGDRHRSSARERMADFLGPAGFLWGF